MKINSKVDDRDVLLMAVSDMTRNHKFGKFVAIIQGENDASPTIYYSDEVEDSISLIEQALKMQQKL